jgi:diaminopimelate epimerase
VEAETLSCGSGAAASVAVAPHAGHAAREAVTVGNEAGAPLRVGRVGVPAPGMVWVTGPAQVVFRGEAVSAGRVAEVTGVCRCHDLSVVARVR